MSLARSLGIDGHMLYLTVLFGREAGGRSVLVIGMPRLREDNYLAWWHHLAFK